MGQNKINFREYFFRFLNKLAYFPPIHNSKLVQSFYNFIVREIRDPVKPIKIQGSLMLLDEYDELVLYSRRIHEPMTTKFIKKIIKQGDIIFDIGAHIGYYTLIFSRCVGEEGKVFAFEPDSSKFNILKQNIELNQCKNVIIVNKAVSDRNENQSFYGSIFESIKLDDFFADKNFKVDLIKMDIEGAEGKAITGMKDILKINDQNLLIVSEFWPDALTHFGYRSANLLDILRNYGYHPIIQISEQKQKQSYIFNEDTLIGLKEPANLIFLNLNYESPEFFDEIKKQNLTD